jgi:hypothetical protein
LAASILFSTDYTVNSFLGDEPADRTVELTAGDRLDVIIWGEHDGDGVASFNVSLLYSPQILEYVSVGTFAEMANHTFSRNPATGGDINPYATDQAIDEFTREVILTAADTDASPNGEAPARLIWATFDVKNDTDVDLLGLFALDQNESAEADDNVVFDSAGDFQEASTEISDDSFMLFDVHPAEVDPPLPDLHNEIEPTDVNEDGVTDRMDAIIIAHDVVNNGERTIEQAVTGGTVPDSKVDVNNDGTIGSVHDIFQAAGFFSKRMLLASMQGS